MVSSSLMEEGGRGSVHLPTIIISGSNTVYDHTEMVGYPRR